MGCIPRLCAVFHLSSKRRSALQATASQFPRPKETERVLAQLDEIEGIHRSSKQAVYLSLPLDKSASETRLVTLLPGAFDDPIRCTLETISLDTITSYDALSYVWGDVIGDEPIFVNQRRFQVTANLHSALRHLRYSTGQRKLWIDAICIDQQNTQERNHQVRNITSIYRNAASVLIWLGMQDIAKEDRFLQFMERFNAAFGMGANKPFPLVDSSVAVTLSKIMLSDWWYRIWTKQEFAVAQEDPWLVIENWRIRWDQFCTVARDVSYRGIGNFEIKQLLGYDEIRSRYKERREMSLHFLLYHTREAHASDPKDKIYALLGLSTAPTLEEFLPDYSLSTNEVCKAAASRMIRAERNLRPLLHWGDRDDSLPSWAPSYTSMTSDFAANPLVVPTDPPIYATAGPHTIWECEISADMSYLHVRGLQFDTIETITQQWWEMEEPEPTEVRTPQLAKEDIRQQLDKSEPIWRTIIANRCTYGGNKVIPWDTHHGTHKEWWRHLYKSSPGHPELDRLAERCTSVMKARCVFTTSAGFIGIGPKDYYINPSRTTCAGDIVAIVYGSEVPFILRKHSSLYEYIGECYVSGIMNGEFVQLYEKHKGEPSCPVEEEFILR